MHKGFEKRGFRRSYLGDILVTLHPPRAAIFYCFIIIGTFLSETIYIDRLILSLIAAHFYLQWSAYAIDEKKGRHCATHLSDRHFKVRIIIGSIVALSIAIYFGIFVHWTLFVLAVAGAFFIYCYNWEVLGVHNHFVFGIMWGGYPLISHYYLHTLNPEIPIYVFMFSMFAMIYAIFHISLYGNFLCRIQTCKDEHPEKDCHGQLCKVRKKMPPTVHMLQKRLVDLNLYFIITLTAAVIVYWVGI